MFHFSLDSLLDPAKSIFGNNSTCSGIPTINEDEEQVFVNFEDVKSAEPPQVIFNFDSKLNHRFTFALGLAMSVRSLTDDKSDRPPVMHRFCLTRKRLNDEGQKIIKDSLDIRRKLNIDEERISNLVGYSTLWKMDKAFHAYISDKNGFVR